MTTEQDRFKLIRVGELADLLMERPTSTWLYDANPPTVRDKHGIIPGARLLASSSGYDVAELPGTTDSTLVFYCYNPM
jgi:hypothetical protein